MSRRTRNQRRKWVAIAFAVVLGAGAGFALLNRDEISDQILEVTLPLRHEDIIVQQADEKDLDPELVAAVIYAESRFRDGQQSEAGALGLMQITPTTAGEIASKSDGTTFEISDLSNPDINISYGAFHLRDLLDRFDGNEVAALAAYNAGGTIVDEWGGSDLEPDDIQFPETRDYVEDVLDKREAYREKYADELGID